MKKIIHLQCFEGTNQDVMVQYLADNIAFHENNIFVHLKLNLNRELIILFSTFFITFDRWLSL